MVARYVGFDDTARRRGSVEERKGRVVVGRMSGWYQVAVVGPGAAKHEADLRRLTSRIVKSLGMASATTIKYLTADLLHERNRQFPLVAVYFGGKNPSGADLAAAQALVDDDAVVLPVVTSLKDFSAQIPQVLLAINGMEIDATGDDLIRVAEWAIGALGLVRERRFSFISYRRQEASRAALQLHQALDARAWRSFLDTHSVAASRPFQKVLWDRMNDADLLILLDSPGALDSQWVRDEVAQADQIGMGVLQLVWPEKSRHACTAFATPFYLDANSFRTGNLAKEGGLQLRASVLNEVLLVAEELRARSLAARRDRLVRAFLSRARGEGLRPSMQTAEHIEVTGQHGEYAVMPVVGHVDSTTAFRAERRTNGQLKPVLLYDDIGMLDERVRHIDWLNQHPRVTSIAVARTAAWARQA